MMVRLISLLVIAILWKSCIAEVSVLEKFLTSGFDKETAETKQFEGNTGAVTSEDLIQFMQAAGHITPGNKIYNPQREADDLQTLNPRPTSLLYLPQQVLRTDSAQPLPAARSTIRLVSDASSRTATATATDTGSQQGSVGKNNAKTDRQGLFAVDGRAYQNRYSGHHEGYSAQKDIHPSGHYGLQRVPYHNVAYVPPPPKATVSIKIDPLNILRYLWHGIRRPFLNLNGKLLLGVELGKNVGFVKGGYYTHPYSVNHYAPLPAKEKVLSLG